MLAVLRKAITGIKSREIIKIEENPLISQYPKFNDVFTTFETIEQGMIISDNNIFYRKYFSKDVSVGLKKVYRLFDFKQGALGTKFQVQIIGLIQVQEVFSEQKKIIVLRVNNKESLKNTIVTAYFDRKYLERYGEKYNRFFKKFQSHNVTWDLDSQGLFNIDLNLLQDLIPKKEIPGLEFKV